MFGIGIDIGGTFTDFTVLDRRTGTVHVEKCLSTPRDPAEGVLKGLDLIANRIPEVFSACDRLNHATTLVTNAILERKGVRTALLTTEGFRDVLEQGHELRYNVYDLFIRFPDPIVPRRWRYGVPERIYSDGAVRQALDENAVAAIAAELKRADIQSVAICYLHSYRNPDHERRTVELLRELLPGIPMSVSHEVNPEPREYERTSTTALDAYVKPIVASYLGRLEREVCDRGVATHLEIMLSNGGSTSAAIAQEYPIQLIESGPAAGVEAALWLCSQLGLSDALSFDMGGTTAKLCVIQNGSAGRSRRFEAGRVHRFVAGSGLPVSVPVYDLVEIGAGGGSIARLDGLGLMTVGPESAGADPGPACYGAGGSAPTVTDADLLLGHLDADTFLGGEMRLDREAAARAVDTALGQELGLTTVEAALGITDIVNETMASAARIHVAEKGCDPARLPVIAFGGAGPLHALELARKLGCPRVIFPPLAGVMSSFGLLTALPSFERMASLKQLVLQLKPTDIQSAVQCLEAEIIAILGESGAGLTFRYIAEMWHHGQEYPIEVGFSAADIEAPDLIDRLVVQFRHRYRALYGRIDDETPIELAQVRVIGERQESFVASIAGGESIPAQLKRRRLFDTRRGEFVEAEVIARGNLRPGRKLVGPLVLQERETGIVIFEGDRLSVHESGAVIVEIAGTEA